MTRYVAFLRAINVGGHTVKMDRLRDLFAALGFADVETFIASGNVLFAAPDEDAGRLERRIEDHLHQSLGYPVDTFIRSDRELEEIVRYRPFPSVETDDGWSIHVAFVHQPPGDEARQALLAYRTPDDDFHIHKREIYWLRRGRMSDSTFSGAVLEKALGMPATMRNMNTVRRIAARYPTPSPD